MSDSVSKIATEMGQWITGRGGQPAPCVQDWIARLESLARQHREEVAGLQASLDTLHGAKFSDRCYHALKSRAEAAEAALGELRARVIAAHTGENVDGCGMTNAEIDTLTRTSKETSNGR